MARRRYIDLVGDLAQSLYQERLAGQEESLDSPAQPASLTPAPRRRLKMARRVRAPNNRNDPDLAKRNYGDPVYTWAFASSQPRGGTVVTYETRLEEDGVLRCNCMGWVFVRKDKNTGLPKPRECKHTQMVADEAPLILRRWRAGEQLPVLNSPGGTVTGRMSSRNAVVQNIPRTLEEASNPNSRIRYGRVIEV